MKNGAPPHGRHSNRASILDRVSDINATKPIDRHRDDARIGETGISSKHTPATQRFDLMRILIATDAWRPQVNGVVHTLEATARAAKSLGVEISFLTAEGF